jgi:pyruvate,water dikinase
MMDSLRKPMTLTLDFDQITLPDISLVGGKNASLGELYRSLRPLGVGVLDGFAVTADAYRWLLAQEGLAERLGSILLGLDVNDVNDLANRGAEARRVLLGAGFPDDLRTAIVDAYQRLSSRLGRESELAVRSSATAEDLPGASFAGQQETFLNVRGVDELIESVQGCIASLFTDRAISYRERHGFDHMKVALSVGVQPMVRSDIGSAGVIFTLDPESGFRDLVVISGAYGLGETVVQGSVNPDEWMVFKPTLKYAARPIISRRLGSKEVRLAYSQGDTRTLKVETTPSERSRFSLVDEDVVTLARWACLVEEHYSTLTAHSQPMDIEWAKDGVTGELFILQARPETVHSAKVVGALSATYRLTGEHGAPLLVGQAVGERIGSGRARVVHGTEDLASVQPGDVLVAEITDPDWEPVMRRVAAIVTDKGGRTAHAAIVSRELGLPCIVGTGTGTSVVNDGMAITVCCAEGNEGHLYAGEVPFVVERIEPPKTLKTDTAMMLNVGDPSQAFKLAALPNSGVGLARLEFIVTRHIGIHPMALLRYPNLADPAAVQEIARRIGPEEPKEYFIRSLSEGIGRIAAAFYPKPVIVRTSDFKTNEYARLIGGAEFEPEEENPMLGFRGASRYYDERYQEGFALECAALLRVRHDMGLSNVKVMIPFCRTPEEGRKVIHVMAANGLSQGEDGLEVYAMCELPSNVVAADAFLQVFDGFSIGSNDLTQLVLGLDRDSGTVAHLFDERDQAVRAMISSAIASAHRAGKPIGICGQAPSDHPEFASWLVEQGIHSISLNPDAVVKTMLVVAEAEAKLKATAE